MDDIIKEYSDIDQLLMGFYINDVSFNIVSFMRTLNNITCKDIDDKYMTKVYFNYDEVDKDYVRMHVSLCIEDKTTRLSYEIICLDFEAVYINRSHSDDVRILYYSKKEDYLYV